LTESRFGLILTSSGETKTSHVFRAIPKDTIRMSTITTKMIKGATLKVYPGASHGMCSTLKDQVNTELLAFFKA